MKIKQTIKTIAVGLILIGAVFFVAPSPVGATTCPNGGDPNNNCSLTGASGGSGATSSSGGTYATPTGGACGYNGAVISGGSLCDPTKSGTVEGNPVWGLLLLVLNILTAGVGIAAVGGIIYGAVLWSSAGANPSQVQKARSIITNVVIGIIAYALMYSFLNFIIPGGIFS